MITSEEKEELRSWAEDNMGLDKMDESHIALLIKSRAEQISRITDYCVAKRKGMRFEVTVEDRPSTFTNSARYPHVHIRVTKDL